MDIERHVKLKLFLRLVSADYKARGMYDREGGHQSLCLLNCLQYCAKEMQTKFAEISEIMRISAIKLRTFASDEKAANEPNPPSISEQCNLAINAKDSPLKPRVR